MASVKETQEQLLEAMRTIARQEAKKGSGPQISVGVVCDDPQGYKCLVDFQYHLKMKEDDKQAQKECILPEHLHTWISKGDIVFVTDISGNGGPLVVTGSSGRPKDQGDASSAK